MMTNLFSMFDPSNFTWNSSWFILNMVMLIPMIKNNTKHGTIKKKISNFISNEFITKTNSFISNNMLIPIFYSIFLTNIISLIPTSFAPSAQMSFIAPMLIPLWVMSVSYYVIKKTNKFMSHLVPSGSPIILMPALVMIEMISNLIRPITLTVRLMANITAGHLLMHLLSAFSCSLIKTPMIPMLMVISLILTTLEISVAFIQSYILCTLISLYSSEIH